MNHIFKKLHFGSSHDPNRSNEISSSSSPPSTSSSSISPSTDNPHHHHHHRNNTTTSTSSSSSSHSPISPSTLSPTPPPITSLPFSSTTNGTDRADYFSSEEEFQVQLALAISASSSNSDSREDRDKDQIREATLLSLGRNINDLGRVEDQVGESLSRRYWDYNVLDYEEKVVDASVGFSQIGSTEWVEDNREMPSRVVAYLNMDCAVSGPGFHASATPQIDDLLKQVTQQVKDPDTSSQTIYDSWTGSNDVPMIGRLGDTGSDFAPFIQHVGISAVNMFFGKGYPVYHSLYDDFLWMTKFGDPMFHRHVPCIVVAFADIVVVDLLLACCRLCVLSLPLALLLSDGCHVAA